MNLHNAIMNIPCERTDEQFSSPLHRLTYKEGHRDARHAAAELSLAYERKFETLHQALKEIATLRGGCLCGHGEWCEFCTPNSAIGRVRKAAHEALEKVK